MINLLNRLFWCLCLLSQILFLGSPMGDFRGSQESDQIGSPATLIEQWHGWQDVKNVLQNLMTEHKQKDIKIANLEGQMRQMEIKINEIERYQSKNCPVFRNLPVGSYGSIINDTVEFIKFSETCQSEVMDQLSMTLLNSSTKWWKWPSIQLTWKRAILWDPLNLKVKQQWSWNSSTLIEKKELIAERSFWNFIVIPRTRNCLHQWTPYQIWHATERSSWSRIYFCVNEKFSTHHSCGTRGCSNPEWYQ